MSAPLCSVCYETDSHNFVGLKNRSIRDPHRFHESCIQKVVQVALEDKKIPTCPECRRVITHIATKKEDTPVALADLLIDAVQRGDDEAVASFLAQVTPTEEERSLAVVEAVKNRDTTTLRLLLENGRISLMHRTMAVMEVVDRIYQANRNRVAETVRRLEGKETEFTPPEIEFSREEMRTASALTSLLLDNGEILGSGSDTAIAAFAIGGDQALLTRLIEGKKEGVTGFNHNIAVVSAALAGNATSVEKLLKKCEKISPAHRGAGLLSSLSSRCFEVTNLLLAETDKLSEDVRGKILRKAASKGHLQSVQTLLASPISRRDWTAAFQKASAGGHGNVVSSLKEHQSTLPAAKRRRWTKDS